MTMKSAHDSPIPVTGAAGDLGAIGRNLTALLLAKGHRVRALVRREDELAEKTSSTPAVLLWTEFSEPRISPLDAECNM